MFVVVSYSTVFRPVASLVRVSRWLLLLIDLEKKTAPRALIRNYHYIGHNDVSRFSYAVIIAVDCSSIVYSCILF